MAVVGLQWFASIAGGYIIVCIACAVSAAVCRSFNLAYANDEIVGVEIVDGG